jgi:hypothetical protein
MPVGRGLLLLRNPGGQYLVAVGCISGRYSHLGAIVHVPVTHTLLSYVFDTYSGVVGLTGMVRSVVSVYEVI